MLDSIFVVLGAFLVSYVVPGALAQTACEKGENGEQDCAGAATDDQSSTDLPKGLPVAAKAAIAVVSVVVLFLILILIFFIRRSRKAAEEADREVMVEASQITGPPAILHANYTPETGHSRVYSIGPDTGGMSAVPIPLTPAPQTAHMAGNPMQAPLPPSANPWAPAFPVPGVPNSPAVAPAPVPTPSKPSVFSRWAATATANGSQPQTAPAQKADFDKSYPFTGFGSHGNDASQNSSSSSNTQPRSAFVANGGFPRPLLAGRLKDRIRERPASVSSLTTGIPGSPTGPTAGKY
jgi:hypothetical protein